MKKLISVMLAVCLMASLAVASFAATTVSTFDALETAVNNGGDIVLGDNIEISTTIRINGGQTVNLDLNGKTIFGPDDGRANWYAFVVKDGTLTMDDTVGGGMIDAKCYGVSVSGTDAAFIMNGGKIEATTNGTLSACVVNNGGKVEINDGELVSDVWCVTAEGYDGKVAEVVINGGELTVEGSSQDYAVVVQLGGRYNTDGASVEINGGTLTGDEIIAVPDDNAGGSTEGEISGGTFSNTDGLSDYLADGAVLGEDGVVTTPEAEVEEEEDNDEPTPEEIERDRIVAAILAAKDGETVTLDVKKLDVVSRFIADAMSGKNVNLEYALGEETVTVNGKNVPKTPAYRVWYSLELFAQFA